MRKEDAIELLSINGREVRITNPGKLYFSKQTKLSKLYFVRYYLSVASGALVGIRDRPLALKRSVNGAEGEAFYQKRAPAQRPPWLRTVTLPRRGAALNIESGVRDLYRTSLAATLIPDAQNTAAIGNRRRTATMSSTMIPRLPSQRVMRKNLSLSPLICCF